MKTSVATLVFIIAFFGMYFVLSAFGLAFGLDYSECVSRVDWFIIYSLFIGWWLAGIFAHDVYEDMEKREEAAWRNRSTF
jgi:hypothetical protein